MNLQLEAPSVGLRAILVSREDLRLVGLDGGGLHLSRGGSVDCTTVVVHDSQHALQLRDADLIALNDGVEVRGSVDSHILNSWAESHTVVPMQQPRLPQISNGSRLRGLRQKLIFLILNGS